ncbi:MAG: hypothetical protein Kow0096_11620 [Thiohalomonadaceae bacterium]
MGRGAAISLPTKWGGLGRGSGEWPQHPLPASPTSVGEEWWGVPPCATEAINVCNISLDGTLPPHIARLGCKDIGNR